MWLEHLKPGDKVLVRSRYFSQDQIETVKSCGKKFISLEGWEDKTRFHVANGCGVKREYPNSYQLFPATKETLEEIENQKTKIQLARKLEATDFRKLPLGVLKQIAEVIDGVD
jgi:hypothetical protein